MKISVLIPCHNEEKSIRKCISSCLEQTRRPDQIVVVNDGSTDKSPSILRDFGKKINLINVYPATGNKSHAQEIGLRNITGDIFITTDGDTIMDKNCIEELEKNFLDNKVAAVAGYVKSIKHNWLTTCRAYDYCIGQNIHKTAQCYLNFMYVIPGSASAFRTNIFKENIGFDHDTLTEDLDFTYKLHKSGFRIYFNKKAIIYTQDPPNLYSYINQMRRWLGGGCQNLIKHLDTKIIDDPRRTLELSLIFIDGLVFSLMLFIIPLINVIFAARLVLLYLLAVCFFSIYAAAKERRLDILAVPFFYVILLYLNAWIFLEQFTKEVIFRKHNLVWFHPERIEI